MPSRLIYKICSADAWAEAEARGTFTGAAIDIEDGYIHFSTGMQARETARRHFAGQDGLVLVAVEADVLGDALKWEVSRGGELFPHLYAPLPVSAVRSVDPLPLGENGHVFPPMDEDDG